jgi:hypothetical protein
VRDRVGYNNVMGYRPGVGLLDQEGRTPYGDSVQLGREVAPGGSPATPSGRGRAVKGWACMGR